MPSAPTPAGQRVRNSRREVPSSSTSVAHLEERLSAAVRRPASTATWESSASSVDVCSQISEIARAAVRAGAADADGEKRAFRQAVRDPRWVPNPARPSRCRRVLLDRVPPAHAGRREPLPVLSSRSGITRRRITRCPSGPCRCWAAGPVWSGPRAAESRVVGCQRRSPKQENRRGDSARRVRSL